VAAKVILGRDVKMTVERGQWLPFTWPSEGMEKSEVIISFHPSYIMRQEGEAYDRIKGQSLADFSAMASRLDSLK
jgi:uracil-DNA glycosylase